MTLSTGKPTSLRASFTTNTVPVIRAARATAGQRSGAVVVQSRGALVVGRFGQACGPCRSRCALDRVVDGQCDQDTHPQTRSGFALLGCRGAVVHWLAHHRRGLP